mgnify:CR=1 FL=1
MRESIIEAYLKKQVKALDGEALKFVSPGRRHVSDRLCIVPYRMLAPPFIGLVETKRPKGKLRKGQVRFAQRLDALGVPNYTLDTKLAIDKWITYLRKAGYGRETGTTKSP